MKPLTFSRHIVLKTGPSLRNTRLFFYVGQPSEAILTPQLKMDMKGASTLHLITLVICVAAFVMNFVCVFIPNWVNGIIVGRNVYFGVWQYCQVEPGIGSISSRYTCSSVETQGMSQIVYIYTYFICLSSKVKNNRRTSNEMQMNYKQARRLFFFLFKYNLFHFSSHTMAEAFIGGSRKGTTNRWQDTVAISHG